MTGDAYSPARGRVTRRAAHVTHGLVLGKFMPYHRGHAHLIRTARAQVDRLTVLVCSTPHEPIPGGYRYQWVRADNPDCRVVHVTDDVPQAPEDHAEFWSIWTELVARYAGPVDRVFTSEHYGDELAERLGAAHVCVDLDRAIEPVSGTAIRHDPMRYWDFLPDVVRPYFVRRVALLGTESVGKSVLSQRLAEEFATVWVPEYGRDYCIDRDALSLALVDFEAIAWGQATWEDEAASRANRVLVCDTELHTTATWSDLVAGQRPSWLTAAARARQYDLILLLAPDVPWAQDGVRVLEQRRIEHHERLRAELDAAGRDYLTLGGNFEDRTRAAIDAVRALIAEPGIHPGARDQ